MVLVEMGSGLVEREYANVLVVFWKKPYLYYCLWNIFVVLAWVGFGEESGWISGAENFVGDVFFGHCWYVFLPGRWGL